jgi:hypothetical protein
VLSEELVRSQPVVLSYRVRDVFAGHLGPRDHAFTVLPRKGDERYLRPPPRGRTELQFIGVELDYPSGSVPVSTGASARANHQE